MARKASDMLDVFRLRPESSGTDSKPKQKTGRGSKASTKPKRTKASKSARAEDVVLSLTRRQTMYAGCVGVLLLALSFTLGVGLGGGDEGQGGPALRRDAPQPWYILGELPMASALSQKDIDIRDAARQLRRELAVAQDKLSLSKTRNRYRLWVGPFDTRDAAFRYHANYQLDTFRHQGISPFNPGQFVQERPPQ